VWDQAGVAVLHVLSSVKTHQRLAAALLAKHGTNYKVRRGAGRCGPLVDGVLDQAMERDMKLNEKQLTENRLQKLCARFILLDPSQRVTPLPSSVAQST
jgi:hypothetical protein